MKKETKEKLKSIGEGILFFTFIVYWMIMAVLLKAAFPEFFR